MNETEGTLHKAIQGGKWSGLGLVVQKIIGFGTFFVLARLLAPDDYGAITIILMFVGALETFSTPGFANAIIQRRGDTNAYLDVYWTFNLLRALGIAILIYFVAPFAGAFFHITDPRVVTLLRFSGLLSVIQALSNLGSIFFFKTLDFKTLFIRDLSGQLAFIAVAIPIALANPSVLALFAGYIAQNIAGVIVGYAYHPNRPKFSFQFGRLRDLSSYGGWVMAQNALGQVNYLVESSIVGRFSGPANLGLYSRANSIASLPSSALFTIVTKVGFPAYARIQGDMQKLRDGFLRSFDIALLTMIPFLVIILLFGEPLTQILLGAKWLGMVSAMKVLVIALTFEGLAVITYPLLDGAGFPDVRFKMSVAQFSISAPLLLVLTRYFSIFGAATAMLINGFALALIASYWSSRYLHLRFADVKVPLAVISGATLMTMLAAAPLYMYSASLSAPVFIVLLGVPALAYIAGIIFIGRRFNTGPYYTLQTIMRTIV